MAMIDFRRVHLAIIGLTIVYLLFELPFSAQLLDAVGGNASIHEVEGMETKGRLLAGFAFALFGLSYVSIPSFLFVHVVRNPLDSMASLKAIGFEKTMPRSFAAKAALLRTFLDAGRDYADANPSTSMTLQYEDLVREPAETVTNLFHWLGEKPELAVLENFYRPERGAGIEDPKVKKTRSIHSKSIGRGSKELTRHELQIVEHAMNSPVQFNNAATTDLSRLWRFFRTIKESMKRIQ